MSEKTRKFWMLVGILTPALLIAACQAKTIGQQASNDNGSYTVVSVQELQELLEDKDFTLINVHTPWQGDIPQTDKRLAYDQIEQSLAQLPAEKDTKIVVYCLTSGMAKIAVNSLLRMGYKNVWMLEGGTTAWEEEGFSLEK
jgi:rhodanese-related sulfurtransferase